MSDRLPAPRAADDTKPDNDKATQPQTMKIDITADKAQYGRGDLVTFSIVARNISDRVQSVSFPSGQNFDVIATREIKGDGKETDKPKPDWRWSDGKMFTMNFRTVSIKPGETRTFGATWEQKFSEGTPAPRGRYQIIGELATLPRFASAPLVIELVN